MRARTPILLLLALVGLGACQDNPTAPGDDLPAARFEAQLSGAISTTLDGEAHSADGTNTDELRVWGVDMDGALGDHELYLLVRNNRIPDPGSTFSMGPWTGAVPPQGMAAAVLTVREGSAFAFFRSAAGAVTVTDRTADRDEARGTFQATLVSEAGDTVVAEGRFHSREDPDEMDSILDAG